MKSDEAYLRHILDAIARIESYAAVGREGFLSTAHWQDATIRQLEIIGEASKRLSPSIRQMAPEIPWRRISGLRDVLIHDYMGIDLPMVWEIVDQRLPELKTAVRRILEAGTQVSH